MRRRLLESDTCATAQSMVRACPEQAIPQTAGQLLEQAAPPYTRLKSRAG